MCCRSINSSLLQLEEDRILNRSRCQQLERRSAVTSSGRAATLPSVRREHRHSWRWSWMRSGVPRYGQQNVISYGDTVACNCSRLVKVKLVEDSVRTKNAKCMIMSSCNSSICWHCQNFWPGVPKLLHAFYVCSLFIPYSRHHFPFWYQHIFISQYDARAEKPMKQMWDWTEVQLQFWCLSAPKMSIFAEWCDTSRTFGTMQRLWDRNLDVKKKLKIWKMFKMKNPTFTADQCQLCRKDLENNGITRNRDTFIQTKNV